MVHHLIDFLCAVNTLGRGVFVSAAVISVVEWNITSFPLAVNIVIANHVGLR
ncbi:hypothetical protein [Xenococcus sp. PCC 7305]|uniref:hypothetical protein n=1 Tax=Xenococcus sp. PCC 7305 TaxID=102125 RepID=UPI00030BBE66|nr:hypothetical protein [Xenococcus sp. PCC 7305]